MEKIVLMLVALLMVLGLSTAGFAYEQKTVGTTGAGSQTENGMDHWLGTYTGEIVSMDRNGQSIVVKGNDGDRSFDVSGITMKGAPETHSLVTVIYSTENGKRVASSVSIVPNKVSSRMRWLYEKYVS